MKQISETNHRPRSSMTFALPDRGGSGLWLALLGVLALVATGALHCVVPFAALAVVLAGTLKRRHAVSAMAAIWFVNQGIGFACYGYPHTVNTLLWGVAIGAAAVAAVSIAHGVLHRVQRWPRLWVAVAALAAAYVGYEALLLACGVFLGGVATGFAPPVVAELALQNLAWFAGLVALNELVAVCSARYLRVPRLLAADAS